MEEVHQTCRLCGDSVPARLDLDSRLPGYEGWADCTPLRFFRQGNAALLHHRCADAAVRDMIDPDRNWFACQAPTRAIDEDALFEAYCDDCELRWVESGAAYWNNA